jgi:hypothetical protein
MRRAAMIDRLAIPAANLPSYTEHVPHSEN